MTGGNPGTEMAAAKPSCLPSRPAWRARGRRQAKLPAVPSPESVFPANGCPRPALVPGAGGRGSRDPVRGALPDSAEMRGLTMEQPSATLLRSARRHNPLAGPDLTRSETGAASARMGEASARGTSDRAPARAAVPAGHRQLGGAPASHRGLAAIEPATAPGQRAALAGLHAAPGDGPRDVGGRRALEELRQRQM